MVKHAFHIFSLLSIITFSVVTTVFHIFKFCLKNKILQLSNNNQNKSSSRSSLASYSKFRNAKYTIIIVTDKKQMYYARNIFNIKHHHHPS